LLTVCLLFSCRSEDNSAKDNDSYLENQINDHQNRANPRKNAFIVAANSLGVLCGSNTIIQIDPNNYYYDDMNVWGNNDTLPLPNSNYPCPSNGKPCILLSQFLGNTLRGFGNQKMPPQVFIGYNQESNFAQVDAENTKTFILGQDGYNEENYGSIFDGPNGYMNNDVVNSLLQQFQSEIYQSNPAPMGIKAIWVYRDSFLCIPSYKFIQVQIKY